MYREYRNGIVCRNRGLRRSDIVCRNEIVSRNRGVSKNGRVCRNGIVSSKDIQVVRRNGIMKEQRSEQER
jgi:hypothetical protein